MPERYLGATLGKFRVDAVIGAGGFAWVYKGWDPELEIPVALKVLKPQYAGDETFEARFRREAATAARLRHPNIVKIYGVGRDGSAVYFAMDYLPQGLADRLEVMATLPEDVLVRLGIDVASALDFAHREGVIHRDIKVDNILFDAHGNAVVADFGIARAVQNYAAQTGTNMVVGTPQYFSPEQARGLQLDGRADIYSLGITLYRAATGVLPFNGDDWYEIARQHVDDAPPRPRSLNPALSEGIEEIILKCLAKEPADRYATGDEMCEALAELARAGATTGAARTLGYRRSSTGAATVRAPAWHLTSRKPLVAAGVATLAMLAAAAALVFRSNGAASGAATPPAADPAQLAPDTGAGAPTLLPPAGTPAGPIGAGLVSARPRLRVRLPAGADLRVGETRIPRPARAGGMWTWTTDTLAPGTHRVEASVPGLADCPTARDIRHVPLDSGEITELTLAPRGCGSVVFVVTPKSVTSYRFALQNVAGGRAITGAGSPVPATHVVPAGRYVLRVRAGGCAEFSDTLSVPADTPVRVRALLLCDLLEDR